MEANLVQSRPNSIFHGFKPDFALNHDSAWKEGHHLFIVWTDASNFYLFFWKLKCTFDLVCAFFISQKFDILTANEESFCPIADTQTNIIYPLDDTSLVVNDKSRFISQNCDMRGWTQIMMWSECILMSEFICALFFNFFNCKGFLLDVLFELEHPKGFFSKNTH